MSVQQEMSLPNQPETDLSWFVLNAVFGRELRVKELLEIQGIEAFVPMRYLIKMKRGHKERVLVSAISNFVFIHTTKEILESFKSDLQSQYGYPTYFVTRKIGDRRVIITVPDQQMREFIRIASQLEEDVLYFPPEEIQLEKGDRVRIIGGNLDGLEGTLLKVKGKRSKRVVVSIAGVAAVAAYYISPDLIQVISRGSEKGSAGK